MYRQGDVLIQKVEEIPDGCVAVPLENGAAVLAHGEATGHAHAFYEPVEFVEEPKTKRRFVVIEGGAAKALKHEEHSPIYLPPGKYEIVRQREWHEEEERYVAD